MPEIVIDATPGTQDFENQTNIRSAHTSWDTATGTGGTRTIRADRTLGEAKTSTENRIDEKFFQFDCSVIPAGTITSVTLEVYRDFNNTGDIGTVVAKLTDWGGSLETSDWVPRASLSGLTLLATLASAAATATDSFHAFTSEAALLTEAENRGWLRILLHSMNLQNNVSIPTSTTRHFSLSQFGEAIIPARLVVVYEVVAEVEELTATLPVEVDLDGVLTDVSIVVPDLSASLPVNVDLGGVLADVALAIPSLTAPLAVTVNLGGTLVVSNIEDVSSGIGVVVGIGGGLTVPPASVEELITTLPVVIDLTGELFDPGASVGTLTSGLNLVLDLGGVTDDFVPEQVTATLAVIIDLGAGGPKTLLEVLERIDSDDIPLPGTRGWKKLYPWWPYRRLFEDSHNRF